MMTETQKHQARYGFVKEKISAGWFHVAGVLADGTVRALGDNGAQQCDVSDWTDIIKIKCGPLRTIGLRKDGTVLSTKGDIFEDGRFPGEGIEKFHDIVDIACGLFHNVGLKSDGTVLACGLNDDGQCNVENWTNVKNIYAAHKHTIAVCNDGSLLYCGAKDGGALQLEGISAVKKLYCGDNDTVIITEDNRVYRTDLFSEKPILIHLSGDDIANVEFHVNYFLILKNDGTVMCFGDEVYGKWEITKWNHILDVCCCRYSACGFTKDETYITTKNGLQKLPMKNLVAQIYPESVAVYVFKDGNAKVFEGKTGNYIGCFKLFEGDERTDETTDRTQESQYQDGLHELQMKHYAAAYKVFQSLGNYKDSKIKTQKLKELESKRMKMPELIEESVCLEKEIEDYERADRMYDASLKNKSRAIIFLIASILLVPLSVMLIIYGFSDDYKVIFAMGLLILLTMGIWLLVLVGRIWSGNAVVVMLLLIHVLVFFSPIISIFLIKSAKEDCDHWKNRIDDLESNLGRNYKEKLREYQKNIRLLTAEENQLIEQLKYNY
ncbi:MAG: hypothetical protein IJA86_04720 [Clostridia bacterium]|nr:hypothetical protein [Clostridia bacterium]